MTYGTDGTVAVQVTSAEPTTGTVTLLDGAAEVASAPVSQDGTATITVPGTALRPGTHDLTVSYSGDASNHPSSGPVQVQVAKATPTMALTVSPSAVTTRTAASLTVALTAPQQTVSGLVWVHWANGDKLVALTDGSAVVDLGVFRQAGDYPVSVVYSGSDLARPVSGSTTVTVAKK